MKTPSAPQLSKQRPFLNRFTSLPVLIDVLHGRRLTLLDPDFWEDRNDAFYLAEYKRRRKMKTVLALCFSTKRETFHHWKVFSSGSSGVCIEFDKVRLLEVLDGDNLFRAEAVNYKTISEVRRKRPDLRDLPFLKRSPFRDEGEFRVIYRTQEREEETRDLPVTMAAINRITLSPWMPDGVAKSVIAVIKSMDGCEKLKVYRSTLVENPAWKAAIEEAKAGTQQRQTSSS